MPRKRLKIELREFLNSKRALAIPLTYLILFVSLMAIISVTYSFALARVSARGAMLKASIAKQNMQVLDDALRSVAWSFGASEVVYMDDCGGIFRMEPKAKNLIINLTDGQSFWDVVFNSSVGKISYKLEPSEFSYDGTFIRGDGRAITNQSAATMTQFYVATEENAKALVLCYRASATAASIGVSDGKPLNLIRVNIINLNSSQGQTLSEKFYVKVTSANVVTNAYRYTFNHSVSALALKAIFEGRQDTVWLPISSASEGAIVDFEIAVCNVEIQKAGV